jgi:hypothetical protein
MQCRCTVNCASAPNVPGHYMAGMLVRIRAARALRRGNATVLSNPHAYLCALGESGSLGPRAVPRKHSAVELLTAPGTLAACDSRRGAPIPLRAQGGLPHRGSRGLSQDRYPPTPASKMAAACASAITTIAASDHQRRQGRKTRTMVPEASPNHGDGGARGYTGGSTTLTPLGTASAAKPPLVAPKPAPVAKSAPVTPKPAPATKSAPVAPKPAPATKPTPVAPKLLRSH